MGLLSQLAPRGQFPYRTGRFVASAVRVSRATIEGRRNLMSFVTTQPQMLTAAASDLQAIGSVLSVRNAAAAGPTTGVVPAAADEVSALTAAQFAAHAQIYQAVGGQAAAVHDMFVTSLASSADSYAATEASNTIAAS
jgi:hypothetical protein